MKKPVLEKTKKYLAVVATLTLMFGVTRASAQKTYHSKKLEPVASFGKDMAIGLSVDSDNRIFVAFPDHNGNGNLALAQIEDQKLLPYPDGDWNMQDEEYSHCFLRVQDLYVDANDILWVLDSRPAAKGSIFQDGTNAEEGLFKLVKINTQKTSIERIYYFDDLDKSISALNDMRIDTDKNMAYLSDPAQAAIVVLDLTTGKSRVVLKNTPYTLADNIVLQYDGVPMKNKDGKPFSSNVNGISLTSDNKYFYFKPINKENLFRIETAYLADSTLTDKQLSQKVQDMGRVGITHGLISDKKGNIYLSTSEDYSISYLTPQGELKTLVQDSRLLWPDSFGIGTDGYLYFSVSQLQRLPQWNNGVDKTQYPYTMYRVKLPE